MCVFFDLASTKQIDRFGQETLRMTSKLTKIFHPLIFGLSLICNVYKYRQNKENVDKIPKVTKRWRLTQSVLSLSSNSGVWWLHAPAMVVIFAKHWIYITFYVHTKCCVNPTLQIRFTDFPQLI